MNKTRLLRYLTPAMLALLLLAAAACGGNSSPKETAPQVTLPDTLETRPVTDAPTTPAETEPETAEPSPVISYPAAPTPDYADYITAARIEAVTARKDVAVYTVGSRLRYLHGTLSDCGEVVFTRAADGTLKIDDPNALARSMGLGSASGETLDEITASVGKQYVIYDNRTVLFYDFDAPLDPYDDCYTFEAMTLSMNGVSEDELRNAFIDLPDKITNGSSNTVFYTDADLHLGVQTSVYHAQMGQLSGVTLGPALVAGEGKHEKNYTTVRVFNEQQACVAQFLAFDPSVMGGVQVKAARVGEETLIATAAFARHDGKNGDVRIFDTAGLIRMTVGIKASFAGPYTIAVGRFSDATEDDTLLVAAQTTDASGCLSYVIISLSDGRILARNDLDCSFALSDGKAGAPVNLSVRDNAEGLDTLILHFPTVQAVYEGVPMTAVFEHAGITLPADATAVSASHVFGERYTVSLPEREESEDRSFLAVYANGQTDGAELDVGFRENRFFSAYYTSGYNDDKYVSRGDFCHIRTDLENGGMNAVPSGTKAIDSYFDSISYTAFAHGGAAGYAERLATDYLFLEPCFTHRWNKIQATANLASYVDAQTGTQKYVSVGKDGKYIDYNELGSAYYVGTYADGIVDLAKLRLYPLRSFLQTTATAFRGEGGNPEHLVGISPVHEHEINVPGSVGDYNPAMVTGFVHYMLERYGSVENINRQFGTSFADEAAIDAPRGEGRGAWDSYENGNPYLTEWSMYNRSIVSKRIIEAYREALLAGYPPESISAHQMPEGEAVAGFLGDAATRLTPVDVVLTCGTAYGGTRYGTVYTDANNLINFSDRLGHSSTTLGEYCARTPSAETAFTQLKYFWNRGLRMVHHLTLGDAGFEAAEISAVRRLEELNQPRPGYTGGTYGTLDVETSDQAYRIVQIGSGADGSHEGLLKSIDAEGKWEGTVYLVPFHTKMNAESVDAIKIPDESGCRYATGILTTLKNTDQLEITFLAAGEGKHVTIEVFHNGCRLENATVTYALTDALTPYRFVLSNQLYEDGLEVTVTFSDGSVTVKDLSATLQTQYADFYFYNRTSAIRNCRPHVGGVSFDILSE